MKNGACRAICFNYNTAIIFIVLIIIFLFRFYELLRSDVSSFTVDL
jgi:hypothetical protein